MIRVAEIGSSVHSCVLCSREPSPPHDHMVHLVFAIRASLVQGILMYILCWKKVPELLKPCDIHSPSLLRLPVGLSATLYLPIIPFQFFSLMLGRAFKLPIKNKKISSRDITQDSIQLTIEVILGFRARYIIRTVSLYYRGGHVFGVESYPH